MVAEHRRDVVISVRLETDEPAAARAARQVREPMKKMQAMGVQTADKIAKAHVAAQQKIQQAQKRSAEQYLVYVNKVKMGQAQIAERMNTALADTTRMARGLAMLGIAGEESTEKLLRGLVRIQAYVDVIGGSIGLFIRLTRVMRDYSDMTKAAAAAHGALAAAQGVSGATAIGSGAAGLGGGVARGGAAGGIVGEAVGTAAGIGGAQGIGRMAKGSMARSAGRMVAGTGAWLAGGTLWAARAKAASMTLAGAKGAAGLLGAGKLGTLAALGGGGAVLGMAGGAAAGGVGAAGFAGYQFQRDIRKYGFMGGATPGSYSARMGGFQAGVADYATRPFGGDIRGHRAAGQAGKRFEEREPIYEQLRRAEAGRLQRERQDRLTRWRMQPMDLAGAKEETGRAKAGLLEAINTVEDVNKLAAAQQHVADAIQQQVKLQTDFRDKVMAAHKITIAAHQQRIAHLKQEEALHKRLAEQIKQQGMSAAERFGAQDPIQRMRAIAAGRAVKEGTATRRQEAMAAQFGVAGGDIQKRIGAARRGRADIAGFGDVYGTGYQKEEDRERRQSERRGRGITAISSQLKIAVDVAERTGKTLGEQLNQLRKEEFEAFKAATMETRNAFTAEVQNLRREVRELLASGRN